MIVKDALKGLVPDGRPLPQQDSIAIPIPPRPPTPDELQADVVAGDVKQPITE